MRQAVVFLLALSSVYTASFITRSGSNLMLDGRPFKYAGSNMYWLGLDENVPPHTVAYPTHFRVNDAIETAIDMGTNVIRAHTCGVSTGNSLSYETKLDAFNEKAVDYIDYAVYKAGQAGIRLIVPLTDNYHYYHGGKHDFTDWRGVAESEFYTNTQVIGDYENYVENLLNHVNNYTGLSLKNDPTIMAWETGNELRPPTSWTKRVSAFIKKTAPKQLVMDGTYGINLDALSIDTVDIYSDHFYPMDPSRVTKDASEVAKANKVFIVGEYGWSQGNLTEFLSVIENSQTSGDTFWSFFPHLDTYGFVQHSDTFTVHYPGDNAKMISDVRELRHHAFKMRGIQTPKHKLPSTPLITSIKGKQIAWRGASVAVNYSVERSNNSSGPWTVICNQCATDNQTPWVDNSQPSGSSWYRVRGFNADGESGPYSDAVLSNQ